MEGPNLYAAELAAWKGRPAAQVHRDVQSPRHGQVRPRATAAGRLQASHNMGRHLPRKHPSESWLVSRPVI